jgi:hypothetical protein
MRRRYPGFSGDGLLLQSRLVAEGSHVVEPVGKFHDDHPDVIGHGEDHLSHVLGFLLLGAAELHLADFGNPVHDVGGFLAEEPFDLAQFRARVLDGVVEETGCHADHIHFHLGEEVSHLQGMGKVRLPDRRTWPWWTWRSRRTPFR